MILVFGATGTIGEQLISILSSDGVSAIAVTRGSLCRRLHGRSPAVLAELAAPASIEDLFFRRGSLRRGMPYSRRSFRRRTEDA